MCSSKNLLLACRYDSNTQIDTWHTYGGFVDGITEIFVQDKFTCVLIKGIGRWSLVVNASPVLIERG